MAPLVPQCSVCHATATPERPLATCSRCRVVLYCSREHQQQDFATHKPICKRAKLARAKIATEEQTLRNAEPNALLPANVFESRVGHFWGILETREYMRAKFEFIRTMAGMASHAAITAGLEEAMDCLRLCRSDNLGMRSGVPVLMLLLGKLQACYDYIKWWATDGSRNWGNVELPYLNIHDADMTESLKDFETSRDVFHLAALAFIKMTLASELQDAVHALIIADKASLPMSVGELLCTFLSSSENGQSLAESRVLQNKLALQAQQAFKLVHKKNENYWMAMLNPMPLAREPDPGYFSPGDRFEVKLWVVPNAMLWHDASAFIKANAKRL